MNGWTGTILHVDLATGQTRYETPPAQLYRDWIGGKGLAGYCLLPHIALPWDDPRMPLVFMTGPLVDTASPTSGRMCVMTRSPLTGTVGDCSVGGTLGTQLKRAGLDGMVVTGRADTLCGIEISDGTADVRDATAFRGLATDQMCERLHDKGAVAAIGPAGENGVLFANIAIDRGHAAGRNGLGAAFAAKNLKYLCVKGSGTTAVHDPAALHKVREDVFRQIAASPVLLGELGIAAFGTGAIYDLISSRRMMPTANFRRTFFHAASTMNANAYKQRYSPRRTGCKGCHILCKKIARDGTAVPEFETMAHFSALLENDDIRAVAEANAICNHLGMDTISAAATLACYAEIKGEKLSAEEILTLLRDIASTRDEGAALAQGSYRYAEAHGVPQLSMTVKRQELPAYDPRGAYGMALGYVTSTRGGCHLRAYPISHEILRKPVATDRFSFAGKARIVKIAEDMNAVVDSLTACKFVFFASSLEEYARAFTAVTAVDTTAQDLLKVGERICYAERIMNARNGFTAADDDLPARFFTEPGSSGNAIPVKPIDRKDFLDARQSYYRVRGLDENGLPTAVKTTELGFDGLSDVVLRPDTPV